MPGIYVLDVPENKGLIDVVETDASLRLDRVGPYFRVEAQEEIVIDRRATGCRHAVWYSAISGLEDAKVLQHDKDALRLRSRQ